MGDVTTVVTARKDGLVSARVDGVQILALPSWRIVIVRVLRVYLQSFFGFLTALMSGAMASGVAASSPASTDMVNAILPHAFLGQLGLAASMAFAPSFMTLGMNMLELLTRLDESRPQWRG